jgi:hypothetical protein
MRRDARLPVVWQHNSNITASILMYLTVTNGHRAYLAELVLDGVYVNFVVDFIKFWRFIIRSCLLTP